MTRQEQIQIAFEVSLDRGKVRVVFDTSHPKVTLPTNAQQYQDIHGQLALDYSRMFTGAQIKCTPEGLSANLTFQGKQAATFVPWEAIRMILQNGKVVESFESAPREAPPTSSMRKDVKKFPFADFGVEESEGTLWLAEVAEG